MNFIHVVRKYMPGHILAYTASLLLGILAQAVVLLQPQLSGALIDGVQQHKAIVLIAVQLGILFILGAVLTAIQQAILGTIGEKSLYSIRNSMVDKFFRMSLLDREQKPPAWYSQRVSNDAALIKSVPSQFLSLVQGIILIVGSGACLVWLDPIFFVIVLIPACFSISLMLIATKPVKKLQNNLQNATMDMTSTVQEAAASMRTLEAYNSIDPEKKTRYMP